MSKPAILPLTERTVNESCYQSFDPTTLAREINRTQSEFPSSPLSKATFFSKKNSFPGLGSGRFSSVKVFPTDCTSTTPLHFSRQVDTDSACPMCGLLGYCCCFAGVKDRKGRKAGLYSTDVGQEGSDHGVDTDDEASSSSSASSLLHTSSGLHPALNVSVRDDIAAAAATGATKRAPGAYAAGARKVSDYVCGDLGLQRATAVGLRMSEERRLRIARSSFDGKAVSWRMKPTAPPIISGARSRSSSHAAATAAGSEEEVRKGGGCDAQRYPFDSQSSSSLVGKYQNVSTRRASSNGIYGSVQDVDATVHGGGGGPSSSNGLIQRATTPHVAAPVDDLAKLPARAGRRSGGGTDTNARQVLSTEDEDRDFESPLLHHHRHDGDSVHTDGGSSAHADSGENRDWNKTRSSALAPSEPVLTATGGFTGSS